MYSSAKRLCLSFIRYLLSNKKITSIATHDFILYAKRGDVLLLFLI
nr:MAG TPA: hypothetical protein [Caudoviricetes sp.]DAT63906.1 MAG TPA: hypothetical protein [Caudoviricetes sp.]